jgi:nucleotide-binding universal stress UspA family protein
MYSHVLAWIDCSQDARREAAFVARHFACIPTCRVTLVATISPSTTDAERQGKLNHAQDALRGAAALMLWTGVVADRQIVEGKDPVAAVAKESCQTINPYDLIVVGTHQTRIEDIEAPCQGSLVDRLAQRVTLPVLVVPDGLAIPVK